MFFMWSGLCAEEIHVCGEPAAISFITELMFTTGEEVEVGLFFAFAFVQTKQLNCLTFPIWQDAISVREDTWRIPFE